MRPGPAFVRGAGFRVRSMWLAAAGVRWRVDASSARAGRLAQRLGQTVETNRSRDLSPREQGASHAEDCKKISRRASEGRLVGAPLSFDFQGGSPGVNVTEEKRRMLGKARKAARLYSKIAGTTTRITCDNGMTLDVRWDASNFAHLCGLDYYADDNRTRRLPARRLYVDLLSGRKISARRVVPTGDPRWLSRKADVIAEAFELDNSSIVVESGNSRIRVYLGNAIWCIGLGRRNENEPYYPQSLRKGNAVRERLPGTEISHVIAIEQADA